MLRTKWLAIVLMTVCGSTHAFTQWSTETGSATCSPAALPLAFWIGHWDVYVDGRFDGRNVVERAMHDCAVIEHWDDVSGVQGISFFYFEAHTQSWKQVWLTGQLFSPFAQKEKTLVDSGPNQASFQSSVWVDAEHQIIDRTTLRKLDNGSVSQTIEYSKDGGTTWVRSYNAIYRPASLNGTQQAH
ncbi:MAG TPA: hypothetical protein VF132_03460 [Rudaea sp.]